ncbi:MAG: hypothetical protein Q4E77_06110, partial [Conchiformibius sp.]|nr:hypothetical protein [Conchiformibius sp.]
MNSELQQTFNQGKALYDQAQQTKDKEEALKLLKTAKEHFQEYLRLAEDRLEQCIGQNWLGSCVYAQAERTEDKAAAIELFENAYKKHFQESFRLAEEIDNKQEQCVAQNWLGSCVYERAQR